MTDWRSYWSTRSDAEHRGSDEAYFAKHAKEKLMHLGRGRALLDVGCGAADLLLLYAPHFERAVGADFSPAMVERARSRTSGKNIEIVEADDSTVWSTVTGTFDCVTAGGVVQYWDPAQLERFVVNAFERMTPDGRLVLFEIIDPRLYPLHAMGLFQRDSLSALTVAGRVARYAAWAAKQKLVGKPTNPLGRGYRPSDLSALAQQHGLHLDVAWSMYYEYRFHAILTRAAR